MQDNFYGAAYHGRHMPVTPKAGATTILDARKFQEFGYIQEANRQFFHPLGLALSVAIDNDTGRYSIGPIYDARHDPEGWLYADLSDEDSRLKFNRIAAEREKFAAVRKEKYGFIVQPIGDKQV